MKVLISVLGLFFFFSSCKEKVVYPYAIKDFSKEIQPCLREMVESGVVKYYGNAVDLCDSLISRKELIRLTLSEHPLLRAEALGMMRTRKGDDFTDIFLSHLGDTAIVTTDEGEFGLGHKMVADYMLERYEWKNGKVRDKAVEKVIMEHNYLVSAYRVMLELEPSEKYYKIIRKMVQRDRPFDELEYAMLSLARYKKKEDIALIKNILMEQFWRMDDFSFWLLKDFPDTAYWEVLHKYAKYSYMNYHDDAGYESSRSFIKMLGSCKNDSSANILSYLVDKFETILPRNNETVTEGKWMIYYAIWDNQCEAYAQLIKKIKPIILEHEKTANTSTTLRKPYSDFNSHRVSLAADTGTVPFIKWRYYYYW